jgi:hypothetical protein
MVACPEREVIPTASAHERIVREACGLSQHDEMVILADERLCQGLRFAWRLAVWPRGEAGPVWLGAPCFAHAGESASSLRRRVFRAAAHHLFDARAMSASL